MTPETIGKLYGYTYWAGERLWDCIMQLNDEQFVQPVDYSMGPVRNHVVHLMSSTRRWMKRIQGAAVPPHLPFEDYPTRAATKAKWGEMKAEVLAYVGSLDQAGLDEVMAWEIPSRGLRHRNRRWELLMHVANHASDHRAQVLAVLHLHFGVETVEQDMLFYLAGAEANG